MEKVSSPQKPQKFPDVLGLLSNFYRRLGAIRRTSEVSVGGKQTREIDWNVLKAAREAKEEMERRKWELWGMYGRR